MTDEKQTIFIKKPAGFPFFFITGNLPDDVVTTLEKELSYYVKGADYRQAALAEKHAKENMEREKRGEPLVDYPPWDGKVHFLKVAKNKKLFFPVGFESRVRKVLGIYDIDIVKSLDYDHDEQPEEFCWAGPPMRDYQNAAILKALWARGGVVCLPTGAGKSLVAMRIIYALKRKTLVVVHREKLFDQWCESIESVFNLKGTPKGNSIMVYPGITVAMVQSLYLGLQGKSQNGFEVMETPYDVLIVDESHHTPSSTFYDTSRKIDARFKFGFSATVEREDGEDMKMEAVLGPIVVNMNAEDLIDANHLVRPVFEFIEVPPGYANGKTFAQVYKNGVVLNSARNEAIIARTRELMNEGRQVYIHVEQIAHGEIISKQMRIPFVCSKSKDRNETIDTFKKGKTRALVSTLLGEGVDIPSISAVVMAGGRKTESGTIQKVGRALRPGGGFNTAIIVDFADRGRYLAEHAVCRYQSYIKFYGERIVRGKTQ